MDRELDVYDYWKRVEQEGGKRKADYCHVISFPINDKDVLAIHKGRFPNGKTVDMHEIKHKPKKWGLANKIS
jgi:hypothetical protein